MLLRTDMEVSRHYSTTASRPCFSGYSKDLAVPQPTYHQQYAGWDDPPPVSRVAEEHHLSRRDFNNVCLREEHNDVQPDMCVTSPAMSTVRSNQAATDAGKPSEPPSTSPREVADGSPAPETKPTSTRKGKNKKPYRRHAKPPVSYTAMIAAVIQESPEKKLTLLQIVDELKRRYSFFNGDYKGWKNSVRHNLSLNKCFVKVPRDAGRPFGKDNYWTVDGIESYLNPDGTFRQRRKRAQPGTVVAAKKTTRSADSEEPRARKPAKQGKRPPRTSDRTRQNSVDADDSRNEPSVDEEREEKETEQQTNKPEDGKVNTEAPKTKKFRSPYAIDALLSPRDVTDGPDHSPVLFYLSPRYTHRPIPEQRATETTMDVDANPSEATWPSDDNKSPEKLSCDKRASQNNIAAPATETNTQVQAAFDEEMPNADTQVQAKVPEGNGRRGDRDVTPVRSTAESAPIEDNIQVRSTDENGAHVAGQHYQFGSHVSAPPPPLYRLTSPTWSHHDAPPKDRYSSWEGGTAVESPFPSFRASFHPSPSPRWLAHADRSVPASPYGFDLPSLRSWASPGSAVWPSPTWSPGGGGTSPIINFPRPLTDHRFTSTPYPHSFTDRSVGSLTSDHPVFPPQHQYGRIHASPPDVTTPTTADSAYGGFSPPTATQMHQPGFLSNQPVRPGFNDFSIARPDFRPAPARPSLACSASGPPSPRAPGLYPPYMLPARSLHLIEPVPRHLSYVYHNASANCTCRLCVEAYRTGPIL